MELRADLAQRPEGFGGEHDDRQPREEGDVAVGQAQAHLHGDQRRGQRREEFQDRPGEEGDVQRVHRLRRVVVAQLAHAALGGCLAAQGLERGQSGEQVEELIAQALHRR